MAGQIEPVPAAPDCWSSKANKSPGATENKSSDRRVPSNRSERFANFGALLSAFIASSWCWLPPLLIVGGISGAGMTTILRGYRPIFMAVTFGFLGFAFFFAYRPRRAAAGGDANSGAPAALRDARPNIMVLNKMMLWAVTVIAVVFLFFPQAVTNFIASGDEITANMDQTVITIEGMTWHTWVPKAEQAVRAVPGVLAVRVDYQLGTATIGTEPGRAVPAEEILAALQSIGYRGELVEPWGAIRPEHSSGPLPQEGGSGPNR